ncbi:MAG: hypothetical protein ACRC3H_08445 [Lachnospiraceae bacterium]
MQNKFVGKWKSPDKIIDIKNNNKSFLCSLDRPNIGINFKKSLVVSEFDENIQVGGVGIYSPIGDGSSYYALWSSTKIAGLLGSGIVRKSDTSTGFIGVYSVTYYVGNSDGSTFNVVIEYEENRDIYKLSWYKEKQKVLHGIGFMLDDSLAFAWGSINCKFDLNVFTLCDIGSTELKMQSVKWDDNNLCQCDFIRTRS